MLKLKQQKVWRTWPEAGVRFLLTPLTVRRRADLVEASTIYEDAKRRRGGSLDVRKFHELVGAECIHDWDGVVQESTDGKAAPLPCTAEAKAELLDLEPANIWLFTEIQGLGMHLSDEAKNAGNG